MKALWLLLLLAVPLQFTHAQEVRHAPLPRYTPGRPLIKPQRGYETYAENT
jgi:hypothetical protein